MKDEEAIDWREGFSNFHWTRKISSRRGHGRLTKRILVFCVFCRGKKRGDECVREKKLVLTCEIMLFMEKMCKKKAWKKVMCSK
jgi:hypothetical protein